MFQNNHLQVGLTEFLLFEKLSFLPSCNIVVLMILIASKRHKT